MSVLDDLKGITNEVEAEKHGLEKQTAKDIICMIAQILKSIVEGLPPNVPSTVKLLINIVISVLELICSHLS